MAMQDIPQGTARELDDFNSGLNVLFLAAFPLVLWLFDGSAALVATAVLQIALLSLALNLISRGQAAHAEYDAAQIAPRPALPLKLIGSVVIGVVVTILAGHHFDALFIPGALGLAAIGLAIAAFGMDPLSDKGMDDPAMIEKLERDALLEAIEETIAESKHRIGGLGDADLVRRTDAACLLVHRALETADRPDRIKRLEKPIAKFLDILVSEIDRVEASWEGEDYLFARRRYVAKIDVLSEAFRDRFRKSGAELDDDAFDMAADRLLNRMPQESVA